MSVDLKLVKGADLATGAFLERWQFARRSESASVKRAAELASKNQARLHLLSIDGIDYGFVASVSTSGKIRNSSTCRSSTSLYRPNSERKLLTNLKECWLQNT